VCVSNYFSDLSLLYLLHFLTFNTLKTLVFFTVRAILRIVVSIFKLITFFFKDDMILNLIFSYFFSSKLIIFQEFTTGL